MTPVSLLILYLSFRFKHLLCDFILQTSWMALEKGKPGQKGYKALFSHTFIHAVGTLLIALFFAPSLWWLCLIDFIAHSVIDRLKAKITLKKGWKARDTAFWWIFGVDQELHHLSHIAYIVLIFMHKGGVLL